MTRQETEDLILQVLDDALGPGGDSSVWVSSMPTAWERQLGKVHAAAVWLVYRGSRARDNSVCTGLCQKETRVWSLLVLARSYRSRTRAGQAALGLLEDVEEAVLGRDLGTGPVIKVSDTLLSLPPGTALVAYDLQIAIPNYIKR